MDAALRMIAMVIFAAGGFALGVLVAGHDPYAQETFPCESDEVLGQDPQFGSDKVGCLHLDEVVEREQEHQ